MPDTEIKKASCLLVDDEPMARDVLRRYIEKIPALHVAGECSNAIDALMFLQNNKIDLIFLDIRMPELLGTEFVKSLRNPPKIIFTTAFTEYAIEGYELDVIDYLVKPVRFERFVKAVNKAFPKKEEIPQNSGNNSDRKTGSDFIYLRVDKKLVKIILSEVLYIESARDYVKVFTKDKCFMTRQTISSIETMLSANEFVRVHRSYIVAVSKIKSLTSELIEIGETEIPIGKLYKNSFLKLREG